MRNEKIAKMILAFVFSVLIYLLLFAITFLVEAVLHLKALSVGLVLEKASLQKTFFARSKRIQSELSNR